MSLHTVIPQETLDPQPIRIRLLRLDGGTQHRVKLAKHAIEDYVRALQSEQELPPITVVWDGQYYWVVDGHHRVEAHRLAKGDVAEILCIVRRGTPEDAQWQSLGANNNHGVRRTQADKQKAVEFALRHPDFKNKSNHQIGKQTGVDHKTVGAWRKKLMAGEFPTRPKSEPSTEELVGKAIAAANRATGFSWHGSVSQGNGVTSLELSAKVVQSSGQSSSNTVLEKAA